MRNEHRFCIGIITYVVAFSSDISVFWLIFIMKNVFIPIIVASSLMLSGCIAVWGSSYNIDFADKDVVQVNYDSSVINYPLMLAEVSAHCAAYGKGYENDSTITNGWGITMAVYRCKGTPEPNVVSKKITIK
ncbi:hypothetical protein [Photobacterium damselae]|uniref:hypothetical protein n=1 Tax=Photobacterium damselae TaxID=38293 RepID=UPI002542C108